MNTFFSTLPPDAVLWFALVLMAFTALASALVWFASTMPCRVLALHQSDNDGLWSHRSGVGE